jgi:Flp pilus assembly protein TadB
MLPPLLASPRNRDLELLEALDRWVRLLVATLATGVSIPDAIRATRRQAPELLIGPVDQLVARLDDRWTIRQTLLATADDLASPDADAVLAALVLAAERGGTGAVETLQALADSIADRIRTSRDIEAERAKPRIVVRQVTVLTLVILGGAIVLGRDFFAPYGTWYGQLILAGLLASYLGSLVWLRRLTTPRRRERILQ